jgi:LmbE family N-acetylglucosaminyl deacetylase
VKVLVISAHPDDEILGVGGTVARHVLQGDQVTVVIVADGATSRYEAGAENTLRAYGEKAAAVVGLRDVRFLGFKDQRLDQGAIIDVIKPIEKVVQEVRPEVVYCHHWGDLNRDHRVVSEAVAVACRPVGEGYPRRLLMFETPSSSEWSVPDPALQFMPNVFIDIGATIEKKLEAMACYESELRPEPHPRSLAALRARAQYWGQIVGKAYVEPFVLAREVS